MKSLIAVFIFVGVLAPLAAQQERILDFDSQIQVKSSGDLVVTEKIRVVAADREIKRGIYRDFPTIYEGKFGLKRKVDFDVLEVLRDGKPEKWSTRAESNGVRVYIGNPNVILSPGEYTYTLKYRTNRQLRVGESDDELYWNVTGDGWAFPIEKAQVTVELPAGASVKGLDAYTGPPGAKGTDWRSFAEPGVEAAIATTAVLPPGSGLTISVTWPKGFISPDANPGGLDATFRDNPWFAVAVVGLVAVIGYYIVAWCFVGRDPERGVVIPLYEPPNGFTPSAVRYVSGLGRFDEKSFSSALIGLAVAGAVRIRETAKGKYTIEAVEGEPKSALTSLQKKFLAALMGGRSELEMDQANHRIFSSARSVLQKSLRSEFEKAYFFKNTWWWIGGLVLSLIPTAVVALDSGEGSGALFMLVWLSGWSLGTITLLSGIYSSIKAGRWLAAIPQAIFSIPFVIGWFFGAWMLMELGSLATLAVFAVAFFVNLIFYHLMKAPTLQGRKIMDQIDGFKKYLSVAEKERLELQNPPERTPEEFERFLPYALALGVEQRWAEQFTSVLDAAQYQPQWYSGTGTGFLSATALASSCGGAMTSAISASSTAPGSSSGAGGGGSSGGGGGGGGGGGW